MVAAINATIFLKNAFCKDGTSPDSLTKKVISEKKNAAAIICKIPFVLSVISSCTSLFFLCHYITFATIVHMVILCRKHCFLQNERKDLHTNERFYYFNRNKL